MPARRFDAWRRAMSAALLTLSMALTRPTALRAGPPPSIRVESVGTLREIIHEGRLEGRATLASALARPHAYALGALARLDGEFIILDGVTWLSRPGEGGRVRSLRSSAGTDSAALMVVSHVSRWRDIRVARSLTLPALEETLAARAAAAGLPPAGPFPFLVEGPVRDLRGHVADGRLLPPGPSTHEAHAKAAIRVAREAATVRLLGFYSDHDQGVFTHHDSRLHVHVLVPGEGLAAHVDSVIVTAGAVLRLPASP